MSDNVITLSDLKPLFAAVGEGIQAFTSIEMGVNYCFGAMLESGDHVRAVVVLNAVRSFESKLKVVDALAEVSLNKEQLAKWHNLSSRAKKRASFRHKLAHWMASAFDRGVRDIGDAKKLKPALVPPVWSEHYTDLMWNDGKETGSRPIYLPQIEAFVSMARQLTNELLAFSTEITPIKCSGEHLPLSRVVKYP